jgi:hypothetical protein
VHDEHGSIVSEGGDAHGHDHSHCNHH